MSSSTGARRTSGKPSSMASVVFCRLLLSTVCLKWFVHWNAWWVSSALVGSGSAAFAITGSLESTNTPLRSMDSAQPWLISSSYASFTVFRLMPISSARIRELGKASDGRSVPFVISDMKLLHTWMCNATDVVRLI